MYALKRNEEIIPLEKNEVTIGRHTSNTVVINNLRVSRFHSVISYLNERIFIKDKNTANGTFIYHDRILPDREILLKIGDIIGIGSKIKEDPICTFEIVKEPEVVDIDREETEIPLTQVCVEAEVYPQLSAVIKNEEELFDSPNLSPKDSESPKENVEDFESDSFLRITKCWTDNACNANQNNERRDKEIGTTNISSIKSSHSSVTTNQSIMYEQLPDWDNRNKFEYDIEMNPKSEPIDLLSSDEDDKPFPNLKQENLNYSMVDEIITLDSDEEDFPSSQLNVSKICEVPDFSSTFEMLYEFKSEINEDTEDNTLHCNENTWFEPLSQSNLVDGKQSEYLRDTSKDKSFDIDNYMDCSDNCDKLETHLTLEENVKIDNNLSLQSDMIVDLSEKENKIINEKFDVQIDEQKDLNKNNTRKQKYRCEPPLNHVLKNKNLKRKPNDSLITKDKTKKLSSEKLKSEKRLKKEKSLPVKIRESCDKDSLCDKIVKDKKNYRKKRNNQITTCSQVQRRKKIKEKLELLAISKFDEKSNLETNFKNLADVKPKVKITNKNRGAFLTELPVNDNQCHKKEKLPYSISVSNTKHYIDDNEYDIKLNNLNCDVPELTGRINTLQIPELKNSLHNQENEERLKYNTVNDLTKKMTVKSKTDPLKSNLKCNTFLYEIHEKAQTTFKKVTFDCQNDCRIFVSDGEEERKNNGIFAPLYKLNEQLIRECLLEFEIAVTKVCSWNVRWLEEQQKFFEPPPLYPESKKNAENISLIGKYREHIKELLFHSIWRSIFSSWNKPDNDCLPFTQFITEKSNMSYLEIEKVDTKTNNLPQIKLWTIYAQRRLNMFDEDDLTNGLIVILNFPVIRNSNESARKTMVFAYVAHNNTITNEDGSSIQRIVFKIFTKPFTIGLGPAKMKVLSYAKSQLRQFQALAMILKSPLSELIINPDIIFPLENVFSSYQCINDKFLDNSQRNAISTCLNCIYSNKASICLVDGYPGTGKSQVIVSLMKEIFSGSKRNQFPNNLKILIVTNCDNTADDLIYRLEMINKKEMKCMNLLRFGNGANMHHNMKNCTLDKKVEDLVKNDSQEQLINLQEEKNNLIARINSAKLVLQSKNAKPEKLIEAQVKLKEYQKEYTGMENEDSTFINQLKSQVAKEITIENSDIVVTSITSCWSSHFENNFVPTFYNKGDVHKFSVCIFDDANRFNELVMLIPVMLMVPHLILIGDRNNENIDKSPYNRLLTDYKKKNPSCVKTLNVQYRINPEIMSWLSVYFHMRCEIKPGVIKKLHLTPFLVIDHCVTDDFSTDEVYEQQAHLCLNLLRTIQNTENNDSLKIGIIISDSSHKETIKNLMRSRSVRQERKIVVETLSAFNGREHDVVILCLPINFIQYGRCFYTAVTRARYSLIICGNFSKAGHIPDPFSSLVENAKRRNLFVPWQFNEKETTVDFLIRNINV